MCQTKSYLKIKRLNPADYTKAYNRARKLADLTIPEQDKPETNPAHGVAALNSNQILNTQLCVDDQIQSLSKYVSKMRLDDLGRPGGPTRIDATKWIVP